MTRRVLVLFMTLLPFLTDPSSAEETVVVGSKNFTEGVVVGDLATLFRLETRLTARAEQFSYGDILAGKTDPEAAMAALVAFRDGEATGRHAGRLIRNRRARENG